MPPEFNLGILKGSVQVDIDDNVTRNLEAAEEHAQGITGAFNDLDDTMGGTGLLGLLLGAGGLRELRAARKEMVKLSDAGKTAVEDQADDPVQEQAMEQITGALGGDRQTTLDAFGTITGLGMDPAAMAEQAMSEKTKKALEETGNTLKGAFEAFSKGGSAIFAAFSAVALLFGAGQGFRQWLDGMFQLIGAISDLIFLLLFEPVFEPLTEFGVDAVEWAKDFTDEVKKRGLASALASEFAGAFTDLGKGTILGAAIAGGLVGAKVSGGNPWAIIGGAIAGAFTGHFVASGGITTQSAGLIGGAIVGGMVTGSPWGAVAGAFVGAMMGMNKSWTQMGTIIATGLITHLMGSPAWVVVGATMAAGFLSEQRQLADKEGAHGTADMWIAKLAGALGAPPRIQRFLKDPFNLVEPERGGREEERRRRERNVVNTTQTRMSVTERASAFVEGRAKVTRTNTYSTNSTDAY